MCQLSSIILSLSLSLSPSPSPSPSLCVCMCLCVLVCALSVLMVMWHTAIMSWLKSNCRDYVACVAKISSLTTRHITKVQPLLFAMRRHGRCAWTRFQCRVHLTSLKPQSAAKAKREQHQFKHAAT